MKSKKPAVQKPSNEGLFAERFAYYIWPLSILSCALFWSIHNGYWNVTSLIKDGLTGLLPIGPRFIGNALRNVYESGIALIAFIIIDSLGLEILRLLSISSRNTPARLTAAPLAYGLLSLFLLGSVLLGLWFTSLIFGVLAALLILSTKSIIISFNYWRNSARRLLSDGGIPGTILTIFISLCLFVPLFIPDLNIDSIKYHLSCPQQYLSSHKLFSENTYWLWKIPLVMEYPYAYFLALGAESSLKIVVMLLAMTGILGVIKAIPFIVRPVYAFGIIGASLLVYQSSWVIQTAKNDLGVVALGLAATGLVARQICLVSEFKYHQGHLLLAGFLLGMFSMAKYVVLPFAFVLGLLLFISGKRNFSSVLMLAAGFAITALPWTIKSFIFTQDPLYPFFMVSFPQLVGNNFYSRIVSTEIRSFIGYAAGLPSIFLVLGNIVPMLIFLIAGLPALFLNGGKGILILVSSIAAGLAMQIALHRQSDCARYAYFATVLWNLVGLSALLGYSHKKISEISGNRFGLRPIVAIFIAIIGLGCLKAYSYAGQSFNNMLKPADFLSGRMNKEEYQSKGLFAYGLILPKIPSFKSRYHSGYSIIEYGDHSTLNASLRIRNDGAGPHPIWSSVYASDTTERLRIKFKQMNAHFLLYNYEIAIWDAVLAEPCSWTPRMIALYSDFAGRYYRMMDSSGNYFPNFGTYWLFEISQSSQPTRRTTGFLPGADRALYNCRKAKAFKQFDEAVSILKELSRQSNGAIIYDSLLGLTYLEMGRGNEGYRLLKRSVDAGIIGEGNLMSAFTLSAMFKYSSDNKLYFEMARKWYPTEQDYIKKVCEANRLPYSIK